MDKKKPKNKGGRPVTRIIKLNATPEEAAQKMFVNAKSSHPQPPRRVLK